MYTNTVYTILCIKNTNFAPHYTVYIIVYYTLYTILCIYHTVYNILPTMCVSRHGMMHQQIARIPEDVAHTTAWVTVAVASQKRRCVTSMACALLDRLDNLLQLLSAIWLPRTVSRRNQVKPRRDTILAMIDPNVRNELHHTNEKHEHR